LAISYHFGNHGIGDFSSFSVRFEGVSSGRVDATPHEMSKVEDPTVRVSSNPHQHRERVHVQSNDQESTNCHLNNPSVLDASKNTRLLRTARESWAVILVIRIHHDRRPIRSNYIEARFRASIVEFE
jgi:hypothetical protein